MNLTGTWRKTLQKLICGATALALALSLLPAGALAADAEGKHIAALGNTLIEDGFADGTKWDSSNAANASVADGLATIKNAGPNNRIGWNGGKLEADKFLISLDVTPHMVNEAGSRAADLKIAFKITGDGTDYEGDRLQVRFSFNESLVLVERSSGNNGAGTKAWSDDFRKSFTWTTDTPIAVDVLVDSAANTITVYLDGEAVTTADNPDIGNMARGYLAITGQFANQNFTLGNLTVTSDPDGDLKETKHIAPLSYVLAADAFENGDNWDVSNPGVTTFNGENVTIKGAGPNNRIGWKNGKIDADDFLIQFDMTPNEGNAASDLKVIFKAKESADGPYEGDRLQVRFSFNNDLIFVERLNGTKNWGGNTDATKAEFVETPGTTYAVDILVKGSVITVYIDGEDVLTVDSSEYDGDAAKMAAGAFAFSGQFPNQNFSIDNLKITADKKGAAVVEEEEKPTENQHYLEPLDRVLAEDDFQNGSGNWKLAPNSSSSVTIADGLATIKGGGKNNRMDWALGSISADKFLIQFDLTPNPGNTNSNIKLLFKCTELGGGEWLQLRLLPNSNQQQAMLQRSDNHDTGSTQLATYADTGVGGFTALKTGETACFDILVDGDTITVYVNGNETPVLTAKSDEIANMARGYIGFEGEYPGQDFSISNFKVTTDEARDAGSRLPLTVEAGAGGSVKVVSGYDEVQADGTYLVYPGDVVTLEVLPDHGNVFAGYTTNTDGLITVPDVGRFAMEAPRGGGTLKVTATFKARVGGRFELWYDDFGYDKLNDSEHDAAHNDNRYTLGNAEKAAVAGGVLTLDAASGETNYAQLPDAVSQRLEGKNYRITVDSRKTDATAGTMQIMFRGSGFNDRYVLVLNGSAALFRHITVGGDNIELAKTDYTFDSSVSNIGIEVIGDTVTFYAGGTEKLSYTSPDHWGGLGGAVGLINMTGGAPVDFDNFMVEILPVSVGVTVKNTISGQADDDYTAGTVLPNVPTAVAGDKITLNTITKAGYKLEGFTALAPYETLAISEDGVFTIPDDASGDIVIVANFVPVALPDARAYYIDSENGSDSNPGTQAQPWKSLIPLQTTVLNPGDTVYLKRGSVFDGQQLTFLGVGGTAEKRVTVTAYGEGNLPRLNGQGKLTNVVELWNTPYVTIENLEITNTAPEFNADWSAPNLNTNKSVTLRAINIYARNFGVVSGITIRNCYIHEVNGSNTLKWNGGIFFDIQASGVIDGKIHGIPTKYDGCLIENNTIINVDRSAIKLVSSVWCNQSLTNGTNPINWYPSTNMVVRGNYMEYIGGDGITTRDVDGTLVEHNLAKDCDYQYLTSTYNVGIWPFEATNTVIQYNEAYNTHSTLDGQGLDCDHLSSYSVMQYNYSHDNEGGFMLIMGQWLHTSVTVRYNISQNDKDKVFEFVRGVPKGTMIYNNTFYSDTKLAKGVLWHPNNDGSDVGNNDVYLFNNLFIFPADTEFYAGANDSCVNDMKSAAKLYNNGYVGIAAPTAEEKAVTGANAAAVLVNAGSGPVTSAAEAGHTHNAVVWAKTAAALSGYQLADNSPMIDKGVTLENAIAHFNTGSLEILDRKTLSPSQLYSEAYGTGGGASIQYVNANPITLPGVRYDVDFFGNSYVAGGVPDIGAAEYGATHVHNLKEVEIVTEDGFRTYWQCKTCGKLFEDEAGTKEATSTETVTSPEGVTGTTTRDSAGNVTSVEVTVPADVAEGGGVVTAPVEVESKNTTTQAPKISITVDGGSAKVEIPVSNVSHGTVAVVVDKDGNETVLRDCVVTKNGVVLNVDGNVTVKIVENGKTFPDTADVSWAWDAIAFTSARELFLGIGANFEPGRYTNRAMMASLLYRLEYEPDSVFHGFEDVQSGQWYANAVSWGKDSGVIKGYSSSSFGPDDPVTREQVALMLYRYARFSGIDTSARADLSGYADSDQLSDWAEDAMQWAVAMGLFVGHGKGVLDPSGNATRAQVAVLLMRFCEMKVLN